MSKQGCRIQYSGRPNARSRRCVREDGVAILTSDKTFWAPVSLGGSCVLMYVKRQSEGEFWGGSDEKAIARNVRACINGASLAGGRGEEAAAIL
jgi:hypothetical protein